MFLAYIPLITFFVNLLTSVIILIKGKSYHLATHFSIMSIVCALWAYSDFQSLSAATYENAWLLGGFRTIFSAFAVSLLVHFIIRYLKLKIERNRLFTFILYLPLLVLAYYRFFTDELIVGMKLTDQGYAVVNGQYFLVAVAYFTALTVLGMGLLVNAYFKETDRHQKMQHLILSLVVGVPILATILTTMILPLWGINSSFLGSISIALMPLMMVFAVAKVEILLPRSVFTSSIKTKMFIASVVGTFVTFVVGIGLLYYFSERNLTSEINQKLFLSEKSQITALNISITDMIEVVKNVSSHPETNRFMTQQATLKNPYKEEASHKLEEILSSSRDLLRIELVNLAGEIQLSVGKQLASKSQIEINPAHDFVSISDIVYTPESPYFIITHTILLPNNDLAAVRAFISADRVYTVIDRYAGIFDTSKSYLLSREGVVMSPISKIPTSIVGNTIENSPVQQLCMAAEASITKEEAKIPVKYTDFRSVNVIGSASIVTDSNWCFVIETDERDARSPLTTLLTVALIICIFALAFVTYLADRMGVVIVDPINELVKKTNEITSGKYNTKVDIASNDEIGLLAKAFNTMAENLNDSQESINEKVRTQTHDLVEQRESLIQQQKRMVKILNDLEDEKEKSDELAQDLMKFQLAVANASDHIVITDSNGAILYANAAVEKMTGYSTEDIIGQKAGSKANWGGLMPLSFYKKLWSTIKIKKRAFSGEVNNHRKDGTPYTVYGTISPIVNSRGEVVFYIGIERDITREKEIDKAKSEFVSLASHQLRTPLSAINWYTEMLLDGDAGELNGTQKTYLDEIYKGNKRMVDLVTSLLNVSRIEMQTFSIEPTPIELADLANDAIKEMQQLIISKKITVIKQFAELPSVMVDKKLMYIVFQNLISNAVKYTPENGTVTVTLEKTTLHYVIEIKDTGMGIPKEQQDQVFKKLFRADNAKEIVTEGTGLGLYIVKSIIDKAKGKISFTSEVGTGSIFTVKLPIKGMRPRTGSKSLT